MRHLYLFKAMTLVDILISGVFIIWLIKTGHYLWLLNGVIAYSPDLLWIYRFTVEEKFGKVKPTKGNRFIQFHREVQKYERVWGIGVEVLYGLLMVVIVK